MADTNLPVTPGSGTNVDGFSLDNANFRQSVVIGDPSTAAKVAPVDATEGLCVSARRDIPANRTRVILSADAITSVIAEAMITFQSAHGGIVTTGITSYTVTAGKTLRITAMIWKLRPATPSTTVTFASDTFHLREGALITSPLVLAISMLMQTNSDTGAVNEGIPDGLEFPAGTVIGVSHIASAATALETFVLVGYEY